MNLQTLNPGEDFDVPRSQFTEFHEQMNRQIAAAFGGVVVDPKTCLSCGVQQNVDGSIPCGH